MNLFIQTHGEGYPLVFFHGWGFNHHVWNGLIPFLRDHYTLYLVDLPGFGQTDLMGWYEFKQLLLCRLPDEFAVLGWSMGGLYAMRLALEEKRRVSHLIAVASSPYFIKEDPWPGIEASMFSHFAMSLEVDPEKTRSDFIALQAGNRSFPIDNHCLGLRAGLECLVSWDFRQVLINYCKPTCFFFGRLDAVVPFKTLSMMQRHYPQFEYHALKKASHMPFLSHPHDFVNIICEFL